MKQVLASFKKFIWNFHKCKYKFIMSVFHQILNFERKKSILIDNIKLSQVLICGYIYKEKCY